MKNKKQMLSCILAIILSISLSACSGKDIGTAKDGNELKIEQASIKLVNAV